jgi:peroxiredoxin
MHTNGEISPDRLAGVTLRDQRGNPVNLADAVAQPPTVVVFIRGHWCPYCRRYLCKLQQHLPRFRELGARVLIISPEPPNTSAGMLSQLRLTLTLASDYDGRAIELFGVRNNFTSVSNLMPHPAVFIFGRDGKIVFRSIDRNYKNRTSMRTIYHQLLSFASPAAR